MIAILSDSVSVLPAFSPKAFAHNLHICYPIILKRLKRDPAKKHRLPKQYKINTSI